MPRVKTIVVLLVVALFVVLPLYELADIGEHWPHDGDVVQIVLCLLFIVGLSVLCRGVACACLASLKRAWVPAPSPVCACLARTMAPRDRSSLFLIFCDLRV
ncbi:MAG TPA: hypothetical protein VGJ78_09040 [Vicinamibacterales bacterium]|jgi:hypothetical protein